ncbi:MAG: hypothetical protein V3R81_08065, partial [Gammaproteobacteria bacterium]
MIDRRTLLSATSAVIPAILTGRSLASTLGSTGGEALVVTEGHVPVLGGRLKYLMVGEGETLVLLHKLGGRIQEWRRML